MINPFEAGRPGAKKASEANAMPNRKTTTRINANLAVFTERISMNTTVWYGI